MGVKWRVTCSTAKTAFQRIGRPFPSESEFEHNQNKWIDVSCLHWTQSVSEIFVSRSSLHVAISSDADIRGCAMRILKLKPPVHVVATAG